MKQSTRFRPLQALAFTLATLGGCLVAFSVSAADTTAVSATDTGRADLTAMYDHYREGELDAAISTAENFLSRYPNHPRADYATYVIAISQLARALPLLEDPQRGNQAMQPLRAAFQQFGLLSERYPQSEYAKPARERQIYARQLMARQEVAEAKAHLTTGDTFGARAQATYVMENYADTPSAGEARTIIAMADKLDQEPASRIPKQPPAPPAATPLNQPPPAVPTLPAPNPPSSAKTAVAPVAITVNDETWLLAQDPTFYTVQLLATKDPSTHQAYANSHKLRGAASYYGGEGRGYRLVHGLYPSQEAADMAAKQVAKTLGLSATWVRSLADIQADIRSQQPNTPPAGEPSAGPTGDAP